MANDFGALRRIMYQPSKVWLATVYGSERWLTDQFVLYNVTGLPELYYYGDPAYGEEFQWPDGPYQLQVSKGFKERDSVPEPDVEGYLDKLYNDHEWVPAEPTEWSVAEHPGKAMLWTSDGLPCLLGESTWTEIHRYHPDVKVDYAHGKRNVFRFSEIPAEHKACEEDVYCGHRPIPFAFAAGIRCPTGQEDIAYGICRAAMEVPVDIEVIDVEEEAA